MSYQQIMNRISNILRGARSPVAVSDSDQSVQEVSFTSLTPPNLGNEADRLAALNQYNILDTGAEEAFDDLTALAAYICGSPMSLLSLTDANRQWFKSKVGIDTPEIPREQAFCSHAIAHPDELMIVPNALEDERFVNNPLVTGDPNIRFYAGAPLVTPDNYPLGTLCVLDRTPRQLTPEQQKALQALSRQAIAQMELRLSVKKLERQVARYQQVEAKLRASDQQVVNLLEGMTDGFFAIDHWGRFTFVNRQAEEILQRSPDELLGQVLWQTLDASISLSSHCRQVLEKQTSVNVEEFFPKLGRWLEIRLFPSVDGLSVFMHDITTRKTIEEAFRYQQAQSDALLLNVLPKPIADRLKWFEETIADHFDEVTVLFADLVGFTQLAGKIPAVDLVSLLNSIFSEFDRLTEKHGLEKIKTVGDAYLVVGGLPTPCEDHAEAIANLALEMQQKIQNFKTPTGEMLQLHIGINTGPVVAGVIGTKKFSYDLWGDTVNIASRMEASAEAGSIQITETTYQKLGDRYSFQERGDIPVKGKGDMKTYLLLSKKC